MIGQTISHYHIVERLGGGGMGEVYRAVDTRLSREVAIKVLPNTFAHDAERLSRFKREAQLLASLNHPHIGAIYGLEETDGILYLVLELVEGETLAERLKRGPVPTNEALVICRQIADAVEAAHEKGIIHRDLKPANVKITPEGTVKVLDFGLAKARDTQDSAFNISNSPTMTEAATQAGVILGTAAYMSPEQARGKAVDKRADIWAFGCVLYEMLTGRQAFAGETASDTIAAVLERDPDWQALAEATPRKIRDLLRRCLQKDLLRRLRDLGDARIEIDEALAEPAPRDSQSTAAIGSQSLTRRTAVWILALIVALGVVVAFWSITRKRQSPSLPLARFIISLPAGDRLVLGDRPALALSPDGTQLVYVARRGESTQLYLRAMDQLEAKPIPGTESGDGPFFSPDGRWLGFFAEGKLKKVSIGGGPILIICDAPTSRGASWGADDTILFAPMPTGRLSRVSAAGGDAQAMTSLDSKKGEISHRWPEILPGGKTAIFAIQGNASGIVMQSLETRERRPLFEAALYARYSPSGHLVVVRDGALLAVPFDLGQLRVTGPPVPIPVEFMPARTAGALNFSLSGDGKLVYIPGGAAQERSRLVWIDRRGVVQSLKEMQGLVQNVSLSPDGRRLAVVIADVGGDEVWVYELMQHTARRLTFGGAYAPIWTPDGKQVTFSVGSDGTMNLFWKPADGSGAEERLTIREKVQFPTSWSPDGRLLAFTQVGLDAQSEVWVLPIEGSRKPRPFLQTQSHVDAAAFSPDGRWLAYFADETGRDEVYVQPYPGPAGKWQVSTEGSNWPRWARNGNELFYRNGDKMMAVTIRTMPTFTAGQPSVLFQGQYETSSIPAPSYDVAPDGQHFVMIKRIEQESAVNQLNVVLNWFGELNRLVPTGANP